MDGGDFKGFDWIVLSEAARSPEVLIFLELFRLKRPMISRACRGGERGFGGVSVPSRHGVGC